jgi:hypothetical protein
MTNHPDDLTALIAELREWAGENVHDLPNALLPVLRHAADALARLAAERDEDGTTARNGLSRW